MSKRPNWYVDSKIGDKVTVRVTTEDIKDAVAGSLYNCPVGRALNRMTGTKNLWRVDLPPSQRPTPPHVRKAVERMFPPPTGRPTSFFSWITGKKSTQSPKPHDESITKSREVTATSGSGLTLKGGEDAYDFLRFFDGGFEVEVIMQEIAKGRVGIEFEFTVTRPRGTVTEVPF